MSIKTAAVFPVNELGEVVVQAGVGTTNVTGFVPQDQVSVDESSNKFVMKLPDLDAIVLAELLTGFVAGAGTVSATNTILQAFNKIVGNYNAQTEQLLFVLRGADMHITTDQALTKVFAGTKYKITNVVVSRASGAASVACAGGIYDAATKGGNAAVANTANYVSLAAGVMVTPTLAAVTNTVVLAPTLYLSLTTGSTAACTADVFVYGYCID